MDADVLAAIAKWPDVPAVFGWLHLTARGEWRIRGEPIGNAAMREFIGRNYAADEQGRWFFQNGPQRVYVTLDCAPWVYRVQADGTLQTHTGLAPAQLRAAALVDGAVFVLLTDLGAGSIDDRDTARFLGALVDVSGRPIGEAALEQALASGHAVFVSAAGCGLGDEPVPLIGLSASLLGSSFGFVAAPQPV